METSLHRDLKRLYAGEEARNEVRVGSYRIDAVADGRLIEIQHGSLAAIRDKIRRLVEEHDVLIVKPIVARKTLIRHSSEGGPVVGRRLSPKRGKLVDVFEELVYFTRAFPHPRLAIEVVLVEIEEWRHPGHGRRRRWRRDDHVVSDQKLIAVGQSFLLESLADLVAILPGKLPKRFHTGQIAQALGIRRHVAQRIAYCLRIMGAVEEVGKTGNARVYRLTRAVGRRKRRRAA